jgi:hypothetical protein
MKDFAPELRRGTLPGKRRANGIFTPPWHNHSMISRTRIYFCAAAGAASLALAAGADAVAAPAPPSEPSVDESGRVISGASSYVRLPAVQTAVQSDRRMSGMLQVRLALDAPQGRTRRLIEEREMWLRDAYAETLLLYGGRIYRWGQVPDADLIAELLQEDTDRLLGEGRAQVVLDTVMIYAN